LSAKKVEDIVQRRLIVSDVNRSMNFLSANADRIGVSTAKQIRAIQVIDEKIGLDSLEDELRLLAELRLQNEDLSLRELGEMMNPPMSKSMVYCPHCGSPDSRVLDSRPTLEGTAIRRRRECPSCGARFTTYERYEFLPVVVVKKDGRREMFDRVKLLTGILKACQKRSVPYEVLEKLAEEVELTLQKFWKNLLKKWN